MRKLGQVVAEIGNFRSDTLQLGNVRWIEEEIDVRKSVSKSILLIRDHASGQNERHLWPFALEADEGVQFSGDFVFRRLTNDA